ncbi:MAG: thioredoxin family protein [Bacillota bacterium]
MIQVDKMNFEEEVLQAEGPVLVDFWSPNCEPCMALLPDIEALEKKHGDRIKFCKFNVIGNRRLAISQKVLGLPTICIYKDGEKAAELTGEDVSATSIETMIREHV